MSVAPEQTEILSLLTPMVFFYEQAGRTMPEVHFVEPQDLPEPARSLLVHQRDMTSTLARFHGSAITLDVRARELRDDQLLREVTLRRASDAGAVEYGAIRIELEIFEGEAREKIESGAAPLGELIETYVENYRSAPRGYFRVVSDAVMASALEVEEGIELYGRSNELSDSSGAVFADVVEVLP